MLVKISNLKEKIFIIFFLFFSPIFFLSAQTCEPKILKTAYFGQQNENVRNLQLCLLELYPGSISVGATGYYGSLTKKLVKKFYQEVLSLDWSGNNIGPKGIKTLKEKIIKIREQTQQIQQKNLSTSSPVFYPTSSLFFTNQNKEELLAYLKSLYSQANQLGPYSRPFISDPNDFFEIFNLYVSGKPNEALDLMISVLNKQGQEIDREVMDQVIRWKNENKADIALNFLFLTSGKKLPSPYFESIIKYLEMMREGSFNDFLHLVNKDANFKNITLSDEVINQFYNSLTSGKITESFNIILDALNKILPAKNQ